jgi:hypothetical protein
MVGITDPSIAFAFDLQCGAYLLEFEHEREQARLEAMSVGALSQAFNDGGSQQPSSPLTGEVIGEITPANFRDQGF